MPKAAVYEDNRPILWQHDIRPPGESFVVYPVAKPMEPQFAAQQEMEEEGVPITLMATVTVPSKSCWAECPRWTT